MAKKKKNKKKKRSLVPKAVSETGSVPVSNPSYGSSLKGTKIHYEGGRPSRLRDDGSIQFGKNILEILRKRFDNKVRWIITPQTDSIEERAGEFHVRISQKLLSRMSGEKFERDRDVKNEIVQRKFYAVFSTYFTTPPPAVYAPGALYRILGPGVAKKLSSKDKEALNAFLPEYLKTEAMSAIVLKASTQVESLKELASELESEIASSHAESWWQTYIQNKILLIQQGYIRAIDKMNVGVGETKFPDFSLVTHDNYLDILEIKKPDTSVLKLDASRNNYYWDAEISRAIIQVENYLANVARFASEVRSFILDKYGINLKVVRPRGIILAGDARTFTDQKQKDDFRLLSHGLKNVNILTYDELATRLNNYIEVLEQYSSPSK
jgi:hypothetical protein